MQSSNDLAGSRAYAKRLAPYSHAVDRKAVIQLLNTLIPFGLLWWAMFLSLDVGYWLTLLLAVPAAGLYIRLFILQHDCGHGSFFTSRRANDTVGSLLGVLTLTPYSYWKKTHAIHHASAGNLDRRGLGDIMTLTVAEYVARSGWGRLLYRLYRHPLVFLGIGPVYQFFLKHRLPFDAPLSWKREWRSVLWTNAGLVAVVLLMAQLVGWKALLMVQLPINLIAGPIGIWLFYVQHQFEDTYWKHETEWNFFDAGIRGSSFYDLGPVLGWFTGDIGVHHLHHIASRIPNYRLREAFRANPGLQGMTRITFLQSLRCMRLKLWDEEKGHLVGFGDLPAGAG